MCIIDVTHTKEGDKTYADIGTLSRLDPDEDYVPEPAMDQHVYELDPSKEIPGYVPKWLANKKIRHSKEWIAVHGAPTEDAKKSDPPKKTNPAQPAMAGSTAGQIAGYPSPVNPSYEDDIPF